MALGLGVGGAGCYFPCGSDPGSAIHPDRSSIFGKHYFLSSVGPLNLGFPGLYHCIHLVVSYHGGNGGDFVVVAL